MTNERKYIPVNTQNTILYKSARTCCICRNRRNPIQIHHIDQDPSNNAENNLVVLCSICHDEAHTKHDMSRNLSPRDLKYAKLEWEDNVKESGAIAMLPGTIGDSAMWTYINHEKLPRIMRSTGTTFNSYDFDYLKEKNIIDKNGVPLFQKVCDKSHYITIYDRMDWDSSNQLHNLYMDAVDNLILNCAPLELGAIWTKTEFKNLVHPGTICFALRGFHFKKGILEEGEETRFIYAKARNIEIHMYANTRHMYGMSAISGHFSGSSFVGILLVVKYLETVDGKLILHATPLAMGSGFNTGIYESPYKLKYGWANDRVMRF